MSGLTLMVLARELALEEHEQQMREAAAAPLRRLDAAAARRERHPGRPRLADSEKRVE